MLIRLLIVAGLGYLAWRWIRKKQVRDDRAVAAPLSMVRCADCELHVPQRDAVQQDDLWFCSEAHRERHRIAGRKP